MIAGRRPPSWLVVILLLAYGGWFAYEMVTNPRPAFGDFWGTLWGRLVLGDLYVGLVLICAWIISRETNRLKAAAWCLGVLVLGNVATALYLLISCREGAAARVQTNLEPPTDAPRSA